MMAAILNSAILNLAILESAILVFPLKHTPTCQDCFPPFAQKDFTHSFWLNLMKVAILNFAMLLSDTVILDSDTWLSSLRFTQKHSPSTLTLTQTNSIWFKLIHSHLTWWWQPSWILPSWIWPSWIQPSQVFLSNTLILAKIGSPICTNKLHSFILTQLDDGGHLEFCHLDFFHVGFSFCNMEFRHLVFFSQIHWNTSPSTLTLTQTNSFWLKLIHSYSTWWWWPSWILPSWIQLLASWIQTPCYLLSESLKNTLTSL